jgi:hypothetical protein
MNKTLTAITYSLTLAIASPVVFAENTVQPEPITVLALVELENAIQQSAGTMSEQIRQEVQQDLKSNIRQHLQQ